MTQFTKSFIWRFIIYSLILGLVLLILQSIIIGILSQTMDMKSKLFFVIVAIISAVLNAYTTYLIAYKAIDAISKKGCYEYPQNPDKWFKNFAVIMIGINIASSILSCIQMKKQLEESYASLNLYVDFYGEVISEQVEQAKDSLSSMNTTFIICMIIQDMISTAILLLLLPKLKQKYSEG